MKMIKNSDDLLDSLAVLYDRTQLEFIWKIWEKIHSKLMHNTYKRGEFDEFLQPYKKGK
jgi:hypothetical protein